MRPLLLVPLLAALLLSAACLEQEPVATQDIVSAIPWPDQERAEYLLLDRDDAEELGRGVLSVRRADGQFELRLEFSNEDETDESLVVVNDATLKPVSVRRELVRGDETQRVEGEYDDAEGVVTITEVSDGRKRPVPLRLEENYYDNDSSLFLWRTISFQEGYEAAYRTVLTGQRAQQLVRLKVVGKEGITVPAGTFQTWRVEIRSAGVRQLAWYADTPARPLVQYDNSLQLFQLTALR